MTLAPFTIPDSDGGNSQSISIIIFQLNQMTGRFLHSLQSLLKFIHCADNCTFYTLTFIDEVVDIKLDYFIFHNRTRRWESLSRFNNNFCSNNFPGIKRVELVKCCIFISANKTRASPTYSSFIFHPSHTIEVSSNLASSR